MQPGTDSNQTAEDRRKGWWRQRQDNIKNDIQRTRLHDGNAILQRGDCHIALKAVPSGSVSLAILDLPYVLTGASWDQEHLDYPVLIRELERVLTPLGTVVAFGSEGFTHHLHTMLTRHGRMLKYINSVVWEKSRATSWAHSKNRPLKKHEDILVFSKGKMGHKGKGRGKTSDRMTFNPQGLTKLAEPFEYRVTGQVHTNRAELKAVEILNKQGRTPHGVLLKADGTEHAVSPREFTGYPTTILRHASEGKDEFRHPTRKPIALLEVLIRTYSNEGEWVLDPTMGVGSTGVAALRTGRRFSGIERDPEFSALAVRRIGREPKATKSRDGADGDDRPRLRYATLCSGIECVSAAWRGLPFDPAFVSEIDPFASAVIAERLPGMRNLGDMRGIDGRSWRGRVDVLWASTPCTSMSVSGKRDGLEAESGQLTLTFADLADEIEPEFVVWENVKHALAVQGGQAFGALLGRLAGEDVPLVPPRGRWQNAGYVCGPSRSVAWRMFDAQYGGVAQRRERVFLVGCPPNGPDPRDVLFEQVESGGDSPPVREDQSQSSVDFGEGVAWYVNGDARPKIERELVATLKADVGAGCRASVLVDGVLRRLTPLEWERLQGLPDHWTDIPWRKGRAPPTLRRRAIGNGVAVPDARWIGERIVAAAGR